MPIPSPEQRAVGVLVERAELLRRDSAPSWQKMFSVGERDPHLRAARQRQVARRRARRSRIAVLDRDQRRGTGRVDRVGGPHQVEPVGDPADDDVRDQPGHRLGARAAAATLCSSARSASSSSSVCSGCRALQQLERLADDQAALDRHRRCRRSGTSPCRG